MFQGIYVNFYEWNTEHRKVYKIFGPCDDKKELRKEMNRYLLIDRENLEYLAQILVDSKSDGFLEKILEDLNLPEMEDIDSELQDHIEDIIESKKLFKYIGDSENELFEITKK
ncbi:MAG: hypothetical protein S4CHLAM20_05120 [Chlamydiia bacterium]|nr:hypothetical protein [Chlamydiia bacterium]